MCARASLSRRFEPAQFTDMVDFLASHGRKDITVLMLSSRVISMVHLLEAHYRNRLCRQGYGPYPGGVDGGWRPYRSSTVFFLFLFFKASTHMLFFSSLPSLSSLSYLCQPHDCCKDHVYRIGITRVCASVKARSDVAKKVVKRKRKRTDIEGSRDPFLEVRRPPRVCWRCTS